MSLNSSLPTSPVKEQMYSYLAPYLQGSNSDAQWCNRISSKKTAEPTSVWLHYPVCKSLVCLPCYITVSALTASNPGNDLKSTGQFKWIIGDDKHSNERAPLHQLGKVYTVIFSLESGWFSDSWSCCMHHPVNTFNAQCGSKQTSLGIEAVLPTILYILDSHRPWG